jgi:hypothetical protein
MHQCILAAFTTELAALEYRRILGFAGESDKLAVFHGMNWLRIAIKNKIKVRLKITRDPGGAINTNQGLDAQYIKLALQLAAIATQ